MIDYERDGALHLVTLANGPNMIDPDFQKRLLEVLDEIEGNCEGDAAMILTGQEKAFCTGLNVEVVMSLEGDARTQFSARMMEMMQRLLLLPIPTVAAINGHAFAAGAFLALAADYRVMREDRGFFCISEVDVGVPIGAPMMGLLQAKATPQVARDAVLTGRRYGGADAVAAGLVDTATSESELLPGARKQAEALASKGRRIFGTLKAQLNASVAAGFTVD